MNPFRLTHTVFHIHIFIKFVFFDILSGVRIGVYDALRKKWSDDPAVGLALWQAAACGVTAGGLAQW